MTILENLKFCVESFYSPAEDCQFQIRVHSRYPRVNLFILRRGPPAPLPADTLPTANSPAEVSPRLIGLVKIYKVAESPAPDSRPFA